MTYIKTTFIKDQAWKAEAICAQIDWEIFYPENGQSREPALKACKGCPVISQCLNEAMRNHDWWYGVRAGMTPEQRREYAEKILKLDTTDRERKHTVGSYADAHEIILSDKELKKYLTGFPDRFKP